MEHTTRAVPVLHRRVQAISPVFTWSIDSISWRTVKSNAYTFTEGVRGYAYYNNSGDQNSAHFMAFALEVGPVCTMHYTCSVLDMYEQVHRVV